MQERLPTWLAVLVELEKNVHVLLAGFFARVALARRTCPDLSFVGSGSQVRGGVWVAVRLRGVLGTTIWFCGLGPA